MMRFGVSASKEDALRRRMEELGVREEDLEERFIRSGGPGGQRVNKTSTCVVLRHRPTGTEVRCERERSQILNRFLARAWLVRRLDSERRGRQSEEAARVAKLRRQKRRRSRRTREKLRRLKAVRAEKKRLRQAPGGADLS